MLTENPPRLTTTFLLKIAEMFTNTLRDPKNKSLSTEKAVLVLEEEQQNRFPLFQAGRRAEVGCTAHQHPESSAFWLIRPQPGAHINNAVVLRRCTQRPTVSLTHRSSRRLRQQSRGPSTPPRPNTPKGDGGVTHTRYTHKVDKQVNNTHKCSKCSNI